MICRGIKVAVSKVAFAIAVLTCVILFSVSKTSTVQALLNNLKNLKNLLSDLNCSLLMTDQVICFNNTFDQPY